VCVSLVQPGVSVDVVWCVCWCKLGCVSGVDW